MLYKIADGKEAEVVKALGTIMKNAAGLLRATSNDPGVATLELKKTISRLAPSEWEYYRKHGKLEEKTQAAKKATVK